MAPTAVPRPSLRARSRPANSLTHAVCAEHGKISDHVLDLWPLHCTSEAVPVSVAKVLRDDQVDGLPDCGYCRVPEQLFGSFIPVGDLPGGVRSYYGVHHRLRLSPTRTDQSSAVRAGRVWPSENPVAGQRCTQDRLATVGHKIAGSGRLGESQYVMKPERGSLAVNRVTTFNDGDAIGWEPAHQDRPIGVGQRGISCRGEQLHR